MLEIASVPGSKRDKTASITEKGQRWRTIAASRVDQFEEQIAKTTGANGRKELRKPLIELINGTRD